MTNEIRAQFPFLHGKSPIIYLDNAATTQKPRIVIDAISSFYEQGYGNISRGSHQFTRKTTLQFEEARKSISTFIHALSPHEIVFTSGSTEGINLIAQGIHLKLKIRNVEQENDTLKILTTKLEHHSNLLPWMRLAQEKNIELMYLPLKENMTVDLEALQKIVNEHNIAVVTLSQVSNVTGTVQPIRKISEMVKQKHPNAIIVTDASQSIGHMPVNVQQLKTDFLVFSAHKVYGPTGTGILYGREELLQSLDPYHVGGGMVKDVTSTSYDPRRAPMRFEAGTPHIEGAIGLATALTWIDTIGREEVCEFETRLADILRHQLSTSNIKGLTILGNTETDHTGIVSFYIEKLESEDIANYLDDDGILVRSGHHCAKPAHLEFFKQNSTVRVSFGIYNTEDDIEKLVNSLKSAVQMLRFE